VTRHGLQISVEDEEAIRDCDFVMLRGAALEKLAELISEAQRRATRV